MRPLTLVVGLAVLVGGAREPRGEDRVCVERGAQGECKKWKAKKDRPPRRRPPTVKHGWIRVSPGAGGLASDARVFIDGKLVGKVPVDVVQGPGSYTVELEKDGFERFRDQVKVAAGQRSFISPEMVRHTSIDFQLADGGASGAAISIDGAHKGTVPAQVRVEPGRHRVVISKPGYAELRTTIAPKRADHLVFPVQLRRVEPKTGDLVVEASEPGGEIVLDDRVLHGRAPPTIIRDVRTGYHVLEVRKPGFASWKQTVQVRGGDETRVMARLGRGRAELGSIEITSNLAGATVLLDDMRQGTAPTTIPKVAAGPHVVVVRAEGYADVRRQVFVGPGSRVPLYIELRTTGSFLRFEGTEGAQVVIDGADAGPMPLRAAVKPGRHDIEVRKSGYSPKLETIHVQPNSERLLKIDLVQHGGLTIKTASGLIGVVWVEGRRRGKTPLSSDRIPPGDYVIRVEAENHRPFRTVATVRPGETTEVVADFGVEVVAAADAKKLALFRGRHSAVSHRFKLMMANVGDTAQLVHIQYEIGFKYRAFDGGTGFGALIGDAVTSTGSKAGLVWSVRAGANIVSWPRADVNAFSPLNAAAGLETHIGFRSQGQENGLDTDGAFLYALGLFIGNTIHLGCRLDLRGSLFIPFGASIDYPAVTLGFSIGYMPRKKGMGGCVELQRKLE